MAQETVSDILGKGFKFEQRIEVESILEVITGTVAAFVGGAHWGSKNTPTLVSDFVQRFGNPLIRADSADFAGMAAEYHLNNSPFAWFTRITDGTDMKARLALTKAAQIAKLSGNVIVKDQEYIVVTGSNDKLKIAIDTGSGYSSNDITLSATPACSDVVSSTANPTVQSTDTDDTAYNLQEGSDYINFIIDGVEYRYVIQKENVTDLDNPDFMRLIIPDTGDSSVKDAAGYGCDQYGFADWNEYDPTESSGSQGWGFTAATAGTDASGLANDATTYTCSIDVDGDTNSVSVVGSDAQTMDEVCTEIEADLTGATCSFDETNDEIVVTSSSTGEDSIISITDTDLFATLTNANASAETAVPGTNEMDSFNERFIWALKKYVIAPTLQTVEGLTFSQAWTKAGLIVTTDTNAIKFVSQEQGENSNIIIYNIPKFFPTTTPDSPETSTASNTSIDSIISQINTVLDTDGLAWIDNATNYLMVGTKSAGADQKIKVETVANDIYEELGFDDIVDTEDAGTDIISDAGTFEAAYTGEDGNLIVINKELTSDGKILTIYHRDAVVGTFFNYSYTVADSNYIGTLINEDPVVSEVITFTTPGALSEIPEFSAGDMTLGGGTSGISNLTDAKYNLALEEYKNLDLYTIDIISTPGNVSESVADMVQEVCEYRRDCFAIVDMPENKGGLPSLGGSIYAAIDWHNGKTGSGRTAQLNSKYVATYFPWMQINDGENLDWYAPSVRVIGAISGSDKIAGNKFAAPAGPFRTTITDIEGLAIYLREDEKNRLYADELENSINPIVFSKNRGFYIDGQKNTDREFGAISRLNVLRTALYLKKKMYQIAPDYFWRPLTVNTMDALYEDIRNEMEALVNAQAIKPADDPDYGYTIVCDTSINTPSIEAQRGLVAIVTWTPVRSIEKLKIISVIRDLQVETVLGI